MIDPSTNLSTFDRRNPAPAVSVIIPNYNQSHYLAEAISTVLNQSFRDIEIIVVDDGSTDNCAEVARQFENRIRYVRQENRGLAGARNTGLRLASAPLIGLLDADDRWLPDFLFKMVQLADRLPGTSVFYCAARSIDHAGQELPQIFGIKPKSSESFYHTLLRADFLIPSTILLRSRAVTDAGGFDESLRSCEDLDLWLRLLPDHSFAGLSEPLVEYRIHGASLTKNLEGMRRAMRAVIEKHAGSEEEPLETWSTEKRIAFGGLYRYLLSSAVQGQGDESEVWNHLLRCLRADESLAYNLDLYYDFVLGHQPSGFRGTTERIDVEANVKKLMRVLAAAFDSADAVHVRHLRSRCIATANHASGLLSYQCGQHSLSRHHLWRAVIHNPSLWLRKSFVAMLVKSSFPAAVVTKLRNLRRRLSRSLSKCHPPVRPASKVLARSMSTSN